jgi:hypothetical protein
MRRRTNTKGLTLRFLPILALVAYAAPAARAVVLYATDQRNTNPPGTITNHGTGHTPGGSNDPRRLLNSGWQWVGNYSAFTGIAISPQHFIIANHIGPNPGNTFFYQGTNYTIDTSFNGGTGVAVSPSSDLAIHKINGTFPNFAPMWNAATDGSEVGRSLVAIGRGAKRGAEVRVNGVLKGWQFDFNGQDGARSWGENVVSGIVNGGGTLGELITMDFDADGGPNEASLSVGDSSGGVFIKSGSQWKLAGVIFGNDGPWRINPGDPAFFANIFDAGGLWIGNNPQFIADSDIDIPASSYATRVSSNLAWINSVVGAGVAPEPSVGLALLALLPLRRRARRR